MTERIKIDVLDKGHVELLEMFGDELTVVNAARVSFGVEKKELSAGDKKLIRFLWENKHYCYDDQTEIFTSRGWIKWHDVNENDELAAVSRDNETMKFESPILLTKSYYKGKMYYVDHRDANFVVTPNHRTWCARRTHNGWKNYQLLESTEIYNKSYRLQTGATLITNGNGTYNEGYLYGFFLGDGYKSSKNKISFHLKKIRKISKLLECLNSLNIEYKKTDNTDGTVTFHVHNNEEGFSGKSGEKYITENSFSKSYDYRLGLLQGLLDTDGSKKRGAYTYSTTSKQLHTDFLRLATSLGKYCKINKSYTPVGYSTLNKLMLLSRSVSPRINDPGYELKDGWIDYDGLVYCATVSTGLLLIRRNNCICVSGNSPFRHVMFRFRLKSPEFVMRQMFKHIVGIETTSTYPTKCSPWNELSGRYKPVKEYYYPSTWRKQSKDNKQASEGQLSEEDAREADFTFKTTMDVIQAAYDNLLALGVAKEEARILLPLNQYTEVCWTCSAQALYNFIELRDASDAQWEIQQYAKVMKDILKIKCPNLCDLWFPEKS